MYQFFRKQLTIFLAAFVVAFVIYLFVRFDVDKVLLGVVIAAVVGVAANVGIYFLEKQFPEQIPGSNEPPAR